MDSGSSTGRVKFGDSPEFNSVKVFSATMMNDRSKLGDTITDWIRANPSYQIKEIIVTQSSDEAFHCLAMTIFYFDPAGE
jgi:hypothetical protein